MAACWKRSFCEAKTKLQRSWKAACTLVCFKWVVWGWTDRPYWYLRPSEKWQLQRKQIWKRQTVNQITACVRTAHTLRVDFEVPHDSWVECVAQSRTRFWMEQLISAAKILKSRHIIYVQNNAVWEESFRRHWSGSLSNVYVRTAHTLRMGFRFYAYAGYGLLKNRFQTALSVWITVPQTMCAYRIYSTSTLFRYRAYS